MAPVAVSLFFQKSCCGSLAPGGLVKVCWQAPHVSEGAAGSCTQVRTEMPLLGESGLGQRVELM